MRARLLGTGLRAALLGAAFIGGSLLAGCALHHQGHMNAALDALNVAAAELGQTTPDPAGHVAAALNYTREAITEVEIGMSYKIQTGSTATAD
jgi:outer membrane murein-binding lipoprotein Lpp